VSRFYPDRVFGPHHHAALADDLPAIAHAALNLPASDIQAVDQ